MTKITAKAPDFKGFKKITNEEAKLLWPLRVVYYDWEDNGFGWSKIGPVIAYEVWNNADAMIRSLSVRKGYALYCKVEDDSDGYEESD